MEIIICIFGILAVCGALFGGILFLSETEKFCKEERKRFEELMSEKNKN